MKTLAELRARLAEIENEHRSIHTAAVARDAAGAFTDDEQKRWDALDTEQTEVREGIRLAEEVEARAARVADSRAKWQSTQVMPDRNTDPTEGLDFRSVSLLPTNELQSRAIAVLDDKRENSQHLQHLDPENFGRGDVRAKIEKLIRTRSANFNGDYFARLLLLTESPQYRSAFRKLLSGVPYFSPEEGRALDAVREMRVALNITTDGQGGFAVPVLIDNTVIWTSQGHPNDFLDIARVENITNDEWKGVSSAGATAYWATEGIAVTDGALTILQPIVPSKKLTVYVPYSFEIAGDWDSFATEVSTAGAMAWNEKLVDGFTNGLGTTAQPTGIITHFESVTAAQYASADSGSATAADIYGMWAMLPIKYRRASRWMASTAIENVIRQAGTTDPNFTRNLTESGLGILFGRPFHENDYMDGVVASTSDSTPVLLGNFQHFLIANRVGMTVETVQHVIDTTTGTPTGQRAALMWGRIGSKPVNDKAFVILSQT